mgnify:CR=1 FL=1
MSKRKSNSLKKYIGKSWDPLTLNERKRYKGRISKSRRKAIEKERLFIKKDILFKNVTEELNFKINKENAVRYRNIEAKVLKFDLSHLHYMQNEVQNYIAERNRIKKGIDFFDFFIKYLP